MALFPYYSSINTYEAGCDEAGRGCLVGPVVAAAVILPKDYENELLNDSKQLSESDRIKCKEDIEAKALAYKVVFIDHEVIDEVNILNASILAMQEAVEALDLTPDFILVDGNRFKPILGIPHACIVKGDEKYASIAAASILAKTYRDAYMMELHQEYPHYSWDTNKGYPTPAHKLALQTYGETPYQRKTFKY
jgi:ribonuclease HII